MGAVNKIILVGNLGADPEVKAVGSGETLLNLRIAVNQTWKDKSGDKQERTDWFSATVWGKRAEALAKFLTKGMQVYVEGPMQSRQYEDKEGNKRTAWGVRVNDLQVLSSKGERRAPAAAPPADDDSAALGADVAAEDDQIPFD